MPIYEYKGQQYDISTEDPAEAKAKILGYLEKQPPAPAPKVPDFAGNPALSPQEQAYAAATAPKPGIAGLRKPSAVPEMTEYTPTFSEMLMGLIPGDKAKAANEYAARKAAQERDVSEEEIYKGVGGARPMFNPEGRAPILAGTQAGQVIAKELPNIPQQTAVAALQAVRAGDIGAPEQETFLDKAINYMTPETPKGEQDKNYDAFQGLSKSMGFSLATMVSSIVGAAAGTSVAGPLGGVAGGMGASGTVAYRSSKDDFLSRVRDKLNQESIKLYNKPISKADWENAKQEFDDAASSYGAWEAVPEALSNAIMLKAFTGPARAAAGAGRLEQFMVKNNVAEKATSFATEHATETITNLGQNAAELRAGLTKEEMNIADAFRQQFVQTLLMAGGMQVGEKATHAASQFYQNNVEPRINPGSALGKAIMADLNAVEFSQSAINKEAIDRLNPQNYQQEKLATEKVAKTARGIAMPPPPEERPIEPPPPNVPPPPPAGIAGLTAAPSESMDTEAMLREALGQTPTLTNVKAEEPKAIESPKIDLIAEAPKYDTPDLRLKQSDAFGQDLMGVIYAEMESHGRAALKNRSLTDGYANKKDALVDAVDAGIIAFGKNDYSVFQPYEALFPKTAAKLKSYLTAQQPKAPTEIQPTVAEAGPFVRKQMEGKTPTTPTPLSIEGALSGIETPKAKQAEAQGEQAPAAPVTLYRGVPKGQEQRETVGGAQFMSPDPKVAEMYAGPEGAVSEEVYSFKNPLQAPTWVDAKSKLGLPQSATMADLVNAARKAGHDGVTFNTTNGPEYIVISKQAPAAPAEKLTLDNLSQRPIEEQYTIINTVSFNARKALREGRINQEQMDKIEAEKNRIIGEIGEKTLSNPTPDQKQALDLADQIETAGQKNFADIVRKSVTSGFFRKDSIPFYQEKLQEFKAQQGKAEAKEEGFKWSKFLEPNEQKYYETFQKTASPEAKAAFDKVGSSIQDVITTLNNLGYQVNDTKFPLGLGNLKTQYSNLLSDGLKLLSGHYALQNEYKRADADKFNLAIKRANDSAAQAQQLIRRAVPKPQDITEAEQRVTEGEKAVSKIKGKPGMSLWTALIGKLGSSDMAELFGKGPQVYQKKLQAKKSPTSIADMVSNGDLDEFLPFQMRSSVPGFDGQEAEEYIKDQIRGQNYIPYDAQVEIEQIFGSIEEAERLINDYLTTEEQNLELQEAADEQRQGEIDARSVEPESEIPFVKPDEGETLTKPTPEGLRAKEEYRQKAEAAEAAEAKANKEAGDRAKADREVGEFTLTGSDRAADVAAAQGQKDIFAQEEEKVEEEPAVNEDGVKVVPFEADSETVGNLLKETTKEENPYDIRYNALMHPAEKPAKPKPTEMLTPEEAKAQIEEWKAEAIKQGKTSKNLNRTIMSLFDASGEWSKPWREAGYSVWTFDIQTGEDINDFSAEYLLEEGFGDMEIWGILAAPPCTDFASSGAQFWAKKDAKGQTELSNELVKQVLRTVEFLQPKIWAMENPVGRIAKLNNLPPAHLTFDPNYYGDPYTKKTLLWGNFQNDLPMAPVEPTEGSKIHKISGKNKFARSLTPEGFAYAFFMANNAESMTPAERLTRTYYGVDPKAFEGATEADEEAIDDSEFQDKYYDGELEEAADIARNIIGGQQEKQEEKAPEKAPTTALATVDNKAILKDALRIHELNIDLQQISGDDGKKIEDYSAKEIYGEAKYILGLFLESGTMDNDAYIGEHGPEEQKAAKDSVKKLQALVKKYADIEVLEPKEKLAAPRLTNEPYTIEGDFTEVGEEKQHALLTDQTSKLSEDQKKSLESQYGAKRDSAEFLDSLRKDVIAFITEGAKAVNGKIRAIIKQIATGVLSVAIVFNPQFVSKPYTIAVPQYDIKTSEVVKDLPKEAQSMSDAAKRAYGVIYPALEKQFKEKDKLFIVADKRSGNTYLFNPDGSLLLQSKTLFGKAIGDYMHGDNEIVANRITPAGVFDLGLRDAKRSAGEAYTAGDYDFGKVFVLDKSHMGSNGPYSNTIMHSVWTHETDAKQRLAALEKPGAEDSRYSFGCINVNKETFKYLITNHLNQMDGAKIFIVPENGANVMDFINGKAMYSDDIIRQKVEPVTKTTVTEKQVPAPKPGVERKQTGRETELAKLEVKTEEKAPGKEPKEPKEQTFYDIQGYTDEERGKRSTSLKRTIKTLNRMRKDGRITDEKFVERADAAIAADEEQRLEKEPGERVRGADFIRQKLLEAKRRKLISTEAAEMAEWFILQNPALVDDLGISIPGKGKAGQSGQYDSFNRIMTVIQNGGSDLTTVHEILHHLERMMPTKIRQAIRKAWASQLAKAAKAAKTPNEKLYFAALMDAHYGDGNIANIEIPKGAEKTYEQIKSLLEALQKRGSSEDFAMEMLKLGMVPMNLYEYFNPSEFWAVNGSDIVKARYDAVQGGLLARLKNWLKEFGQKIKSLFGLKSDASIIRALDSLAKSDGKFVSREMLGEGYYLSIQNYKGNAAPTALWSTVEPSFTDGLIYQGADKQVDTKRVIERINKKVGQIDERLDAYTKETLYHGRSAERIKNFLEEDFRPLLEQMKEQGITVDAFEKYLHNRHAEERNEQINKINLSPDVQDTGSGIKTTDAQDYLANLPADVKAKLERFAAKIDDIIEGTQEMLVDGGLETQETIDQWNKTYKHYVPLQRDDLDFVHTGSGYVGGVGTKGGASKRAVGSVKPVKDILVNIAVQREKAIRRAEQAKVGRALYALAITNPNPKFWLPVNPNAIKNKAKLIQEMVSLGLTIQDAENLIRPLQTPSIDKTTGLVRYDVNPAQYNSKNVFPVRINGEDRFIIFNPKDERALRMAMSLKNLDSDQLGFVLGNIGAVTRWIASINTQYNPVFGAWNMTRDVQSAAFNLSTTEIAGKEKEVLKGTLPAMFAIWKNLRNKPASSPEEQRLMDLFDQMRLAGGTTGFAQQFSGQGESFNKFVERMRTGAPKEKVNIVEQEMKRLDRGNVKKAAQKLFDWLSDYNDAMENAVRLSSFKVALEQGLSEQKAASIAKELTVNFNRKGASSPTFQALYAFINASVQGTARLIKTLNGPTGKKIIAGGIALGVIQAIALALNGYDDGDPPEFLKDKNLIIPIPFAGNNYIILPMPPGLNVFPGIGRIITEAVLIKGGLLKSNQGLGDKALSIGSLILDSFNPLGAGSFTQMIAPTAFDPLFAISANKDAFGRPIYKKDMSTQPTPGYERSRPTATFISQGIAEFLNFMTSPIGTKHTKGLISPTADEIDYLAGQYFGGIGREIIKGVGSIKASAEGEEVPAYKIPVVGKLYGETKTPAAISAKFYDNVSQMAEYEHEIKKRIQNKEPVEEYKKANPESKLWQQANNVENRISKLNKEKKIYLEKNDTKNAQRIEEMRVKAMRDFNDKVRAAQ